MTLSGCIQCNFEWLHSGQGWVVPLITLAVWCVLITQVLSLCWWSQKWTKDFG